MAFETLGIDEGSRWPGSELTGDPAAPLYRIRGYEEFLSEFLNDGRARLYGTYPRALLFFKVSATSTLGIQIIRKVYQPFH